jgi:hypothetical protein
MSLIFGGGWSRVRKSFSFVTEASALVAYKVVAYRRKTVYIYMEKSSLSNKYQNLSM